MKIIYYIYLFDFLTKHKISFTGVDSIDSSGCGISVKL